MVLWRAQFKQPVLLRGMSSSLPEGPTKFENPYAAQLLVGMTEEELMSLDRQVWDIVRTRNGWSSHLRSLLTMYDPKYKVYSEGRDLLKMFLNSDDLPNTLLEAAYIWSLSCSSALLGKLRFEQSFQSFEIKCKHIKPGRLFPSCEDSSTYHIKFVIDSEPCVIKSGQHFPQDDSSLETDVMYFTDEREGNPKHPLADIFLFTKDWELVLVDVTDGNDELVGEKKDKLAEWIKKEQPKFTTTLKKVCKIPLHGVVLAPFATGPSKTHGSVQVVCGEDAQKLLGGLTQVVVGLAKLK